MVVDHVRRIGFKLFIKNENDNDRIIQTAAAVILIAVYFVQPFGINGTMAESYSLLLVFVCLMVFSALVSFIACLGSTHAHFLTRNETLF